MSSAGPDIGKYVMCYVYILVIADLGILCLPTITTYDPLAVPGWLAWTAFILKVTLKTKYICACIHAYKLSQHY